MTAQPESPHAYFAGGTLVLEGVERTAAPPAPFQWVNARWRCPAVYYPAVRSWLRGQSIRDQVPRRRMLLIFGLTAICLPKKSR